jgi:hypothetical protein
MDPTYHDDALRTGRADDPAVTAADLTETLPDLSVRTPDRRVSKRLPCRVSIDCHALEPGADAKWWPGTVADLSGRGVRLFLERRFEQGTLLMVELPEAGGHAVQTQLARVVWVAHHPSGPWILGCAFPQDLDRDYFLALTAEEGREASWPTDQCGTLASSLPMALTAPLPAHE